jgi:hypothetical protein
LTHPAIPSQLEINAARDSAIADPGLCKVGDPDPFDEVAENTLSRHQAVSALDDTINVGLNQTVGVRVSTLSDNILTIGPDGLYVPPAPSVGLMWAKMRLTGQTNANNDLVGVDVLLASVDPSSTLPVSLDTLTNRFTLPDGVYQVTLQVSISSNASNVDLGVKFMKGSTVFSTYYLGGPVRGANGNNESGGSLSEIIPVTTGESLGFQVFRLGNTGTVNLLANFSDVQILKLS